MEVLYFKAIRKGRRWEIYAYDKGGMGHEPTWERLAHQPGKEVINTTKYHATIFVRVLKITKYNCCYRDLIISWSKYSLACKIIERIFKSVWVCY